MTNAGRLRTALLDALVHTADHAPGIDFDPLPDRYRFLRLIGKGGFGEVWLARDTKLGRLTAIKSLHKQHWERRDILEREARHLASLRPHPAIVQVYDWQETPSQTFMVIQYVEGRSLDSQVSDAGPLAWSRAARYMAEVADGLIEVHEQGVIHQDIKPANILWDMTRDQALLTDFGIATHLADPAIVGGSYGFMPPEAFEGAVGPEGDVFSLCATYHTLVVGQQPFRAANKREFQAAVTRGLGPTCELARMAPREVSDVVLQGLSLDRGRRPTVARLRDALRGPLNRALAQTLIRTEPSGPRPSPDLDVSVSVLGSNGTARRVDSAQSRRLDGATPSETAARDIAVVPPAPAKAWLRVGDRIRIDVTTAEGGYLTVMNIGSSGKVTVLFPNPHAPSPRVEPGQRTSIAGVVQPPAGTERILALVTRTPVDLLPEEMLHAIGHGSLATAPPGAATRDIALIRQRVAPLPAGSWASSLVELDH